MIGKVTRGSDVSGLLRYVFGPGRHNEHVDPRVVAGSDEHAADMVAATAAGGFDVRTLSDHLRDPVTFAERPDEGSVWHCSIRAAPEDPILTDGQWAEAAREVMASTGLDVGDGNGVRWVAVRHADDHVHIVATLARPDCSVAVPRNDFFRVAEACHQLEQRWGLRSTAPADRTAGRQPTRAEREKAQRTGQPEPARAVLRREVRAAAATVDSPEGFIDELRARGVMVRLRYSTRDPDQVTGYAVAWPDDRDGTSPPAFFGGSKLAPELSWGKLSTRWGPADATDAAESSWDGLTDELSRLDLEVAGSSETLGAAATAALQRLNSGRVNRVDDDVARATRRAWGASRSLDHAQRRVLRTASRLPRRRRRDHDAIRTMLEIVRLLQALSRQHEAQQRAAQAAAALRAVTAIQQATRVPQQPARAVAVLPRVPRPSAHLTPPTPPARGRS